MITTIALLLAFAFSVALGRRLYRKVLEDLTTVEVIVLVYTISLWSCLTIDLEKIVRILYLTTIFLLTLIMVSIILGLLFDRRKIVGTAKGGLRFSKQIILAMVAGYITGFLLPKDVIELVEFLVEVQLFILVITTGIVVSPQLTLKAIKRGGREGFITVLFGVFAGSVSAVIVSALFRVSLRFALSTMLGMGWYSFTGPFVAEEYGLEYGFIAFLVNILREQSTFLIVPLLKRPRIALLSLGGATTMDNTLPLYVQLYGKEYSVSALVHGIVATMLVPVCLSMIALLPLP